MLRLRARCEGSVLSDQSTSKNVSVHEYARTVTKGTRESIPVRSTSSVQIGVSSAQWLTPRLSRFPFADVDNDGKCDGGDELGWQ